MPNKIPYLTCTKNTEQQRRTSKQRKTSKIGHKPRNKLPFKSVRQAGILSLCLFAVLIDSIVCKLRLAGDGASIGRHYLGCMLYALCLCAIQSQSCRGCWTFCSREAEMLDFFNTAKSVASRIGPRFKHVCASLVLAGADIEYVHQTKYLGVLLKASRQFKPKCSFDPAKIKFYRSFNAMCYRAKNASSELVCVQLLKSICMPVLLYAVDVLALTKTDVARLDHALDRAVFRIFGCSSSADITCIRKAVPVTWHADTGTFRDDILHVFHGPLWC